MILCRPLYGASRPYRVDCFNLMFLLKEKKVLDSIHNAKRSGILTSRPLFGRFVANHANGICLLAEYQLYLKMEENQRCVIVAGMECDPEKQTEERAHGHRRH